MICLILRVKGFNIIIVKFFFLELFDKFLGFLCWIFMGGVGFFFLLLKFFLFKIFRLWDGICCGWLVIVWIVGENFCMKFGLGFGVGGVWKVFILICVLRFVCGLYSELIRLLFLFGILDKMDKFKGLVGNFFLKFKG